MYKIIIAATMLITTSATVGGFRGIEVLNDYAKIWALKKVVPDSIARGEFEIEEFQCSKKSKQLDDCRRIVNTKSGSALTPEQRDAALVLLKRTNEQLREDMRAIVERAVNNTDVVTGG